MNISLVLDEKSRIDSTLKISVQKGLVFFEYLDQSGHSIIRESINQFRTIQLSEEDVNKTTLNGPFTTRVISFKSSKDMALFYKILTRHI